MRCVECSGLASKLGENHAANIHLTIMARDNTTPTVAIAHPMGLGDTITALPMAGAIKQQHPHWRVVWIGHAATAALIRHCRVVDLFLDADEVLRDPAVLRRAGVTAFLNPWPIFSLSRAAFKAGVPTRVGNWRRLKMLPWCNRFIHNSRKGSKTHEIETNLRTLAGLRLRTQVPREQWPALYGLERDTATALLPAGFDPTLFNLVLHTRSNGNGREWPIEHFTVLAAALDPARFRVWLTGSGGEAAWLQEHAAALLALPQVQSVAGSQSLEALYQLLSHSDGLIASGTGPLHLAAALGIHTLGIYPPRDAAGISPRYWAPIGTRAETFCLPGECVAGPTTCPNDKSTQGRPCPCTIAIEPRTVLARVKAWADEKRCGEPLATAAAG